MLCAVRLLPGIAGLASRSAILCLLPIIGGCGGVGQTDSFSGDDFGEVLSFAGSDTAWLTISGSSRFLAWTTSSDQVRVERWRSSDLYGAFPSAELQFLNSDSIPDLFWTLDYDELVGGMVLLALADSVIVAFTSSTEEACRPPRLMDVTGDGRKELLRFLPYGLQPEECRMDALAEPCSQKLPTEWVDVLVLSEHEFVLDPSQAIEFYGDLSAKYNAAAKELESEIRQGSRALLTPPCDAQLVERLREMAIRARAITKTN